MPKIPRMLMVMAVILTTVVLIVVFFPYQEEQKSPFYWPEVQGNPERTGYLNYPPPSSNASLWEQTILLHTQSDPESGQDISSCIGDGKVFVGVSENIRAYDLFDGSVAWTRPGFIVQNSFSLAAGFVFVGRESAVTALRQNDGSTAWSTDVRDSTQETRRVNPPLYFEGKVFASLDLWSDFPSLHIEGMKVVCLDALSGSLQWAKILNGSTRLSYCAASNEHLYFADQSKLICIKAQNGDIVWSQDCGVSLRSPVISGNNVLISTDNGLKCYATSDGTKNWEYAGSFWHTSICIRSNVAYGIVPKTIATGYDWSQSRMVAIDVATGSEVWSKSFSTYNTVDAPSPLIVIGDKLIAAIGKEVRAYNVPSGDIDWVHRFNDTRVAWTYLAGAEKTVIVITEGTYGSGAAATYFIKVHAIGEGAPVIE